MEFKGQGQKLTEKEKFKEILLKKLQKLKRLGEEPMSEATMTTEMMEQKEVKTELPAAPVIEDRMCKNRRDLAKITRSWHKNQGKQKENESNRGMYK